MIIGNSPDANMPVTKTAKRALRVSGRKKEVNSSFKKRLGISIRLAKKSPTETNLTKAQSLIDRAVKSNLFHKNKAARIKSSFAKLTPKQIKKSPKK